MLFKDISIIDENMKIREHMYVGVKEKRISYLSDKAPENENEYGRIYDGHNKLLMPGFYNPHSHTAMYLLRGWGENLTLHDWLTTRIFPFEAHLTPEDIFWGTLSGIGEMLRFGIVSTTDMYMKSDAMARAYLQSGMKTDLCSAVTCLDETKDYRDTVEYAATQNLLEKYAGADDGRISVDYSLHAEYTNTDRIVRTLVKEVQDSKLRMHVHVSETAAEVQGCKDRHDGMTPVEYLADRGLFDGPTIAAHCVHLTDRDIEILKEKKVNVASCPKSNMKLASGFCPVDKLMKAGINLAVATDGAASNNNLNMLEEMKFFALIHKGYQADPTLITPEQTMYAATRAGAIAQGRMDCGLVKEGFRADLAVMELDRVYLRPHHNLLTNIIYSGCGTDICLTMVDGKVLYEDGEYSTLDLKEIEHQSEANCNRIKKELAAEGHV